MGGPKKTDASRCNHECKDHLHDHVKGRKHIASYPADPRQRVGNGQRSPTPYKDLQTTPNLTGTYFEDQGRYRLFINHVGGHLECLLTLVSNNRVYTKDARRGKPESMRDTRLPDAWGPLQGGRARPPIAFRFSGEAHGSQYVLEVPPWLLRKATKSDPSDAPSILVGMLEPDASGDRMDVSFEKSFAAAWPEHKDGATATLTRANRSPVMLERYLDQPWVPFEMRTTMWFPRTPQQDAGMAAHALAVEHKTISVNAHYQRVPSGGRAVNLINLVLEGQAIAQGTVEHNERIIIKNVVRSIDVLMGKVFSDPLHVAPKDGGLSIDDQAALAPIVTSRLAARGLDNATLLSSLVRLVDDANLGRDGTPNLIKHLGIGDRGWGRHQYRVRLKAFKITDFSDKNTKQTADTVKKSVKALLKQMKGKTIGVVQRLKKYFPLTYLYGDVIVEYTGESQWHGKNKTELEETPWRATYTVMLAGIKLSQGSGDGAAIDWDTKCWVAGGRPLTPDEVAGSAALLKANVLAGIGGIGTLGNEAATLFLYGSGNRGAIAAEFAGTLDTGKKAFKIGAESLVGWCSLNLSANSQILPPSDEHPSTAAFKDYWEDGVGSLTVHFATNGARLPKVEDKERDELDRKGGLDIHEAIRVFAACELPLLMDPNARVDVVGHADRPHGEQPNKDLSFARARSVAANLRGLLGDRLDFGMNVGEKQVVMGRLLPLGLGEKLASKAGMPDDVSAQEFRRVDVTVSIPPANEAGMGTDDLRRRLLGEDGKQPVDSTVRISFHTGADPAAVD